MNFKLQSGRDILPSLFLLCATIVCAFFAFINLFNIEIFGRSGILTLLAGAVMVLLLLGCMRLLRDWLSAHAAAVLSGILLLSFGLRLAFVCAVQTQPISDFATAYDAARGFLSDGAAAYTGNGFFRDYPFMIFFSLYEALVLRLGGGLFTLKFLNVLFMTGCTLLVYLLAEAISGNRTAALFAAMLSALFPEFLFFSSVLSNQIPATFFFLLSVWLLSIARRRWPLYLTAGLSLALSNLFRPEGITLLAALLITAFSQLFRHDPEMPLRKRLPALLKRLGAFLLAYAVLQGAVSAAITGAGLSDGRPGDVDTWKFMCGLNVESGGAYTNPQRFPDYVNAQNSMAREAAGKKYIRDNIRTILATRHPLHFFERKNENMWTGAVYSDWSCSHLDGAKPLLGKAYTVEHLMSNINTLNILFSLVIWSFSAAGLVSALKKRSCSPGVLLCAVLIFVTFGVYCLIEYQQRYRYNTMAFAIVLASLCPLFSTGRTKKPDMQRS